jgi:archaellum component FlaF (FlaF/FlaG flagellin family)
VVFASISSNLVPDDTNGTWDCFLRDVKTGITTRVSVGPNGAQAPEGGGEPSISANGRYVAFDSHDSTLVANDTNYVTDSFVYDRQTGTTERITIASDGTQANDGNEFPLLSADGRFVAFTSFATNLVPNDTNHTSDVFVHDRQTGTTTRVSVSSSGAQSVGGAVTDPANHLCSISADGRYIVFMSRAINLVPDDTNSSPDIFVHDMQTGATTRIDLSSTGTEGNGPGVTQSTKAGISADGRYVAFSSSHPNLVAGDTNQTDDIFVRDRQLNTTTRVSVGLNGAQSNGPSVEPAISADGRYVAFASDANNLVPDDTNNSRDVFVYDRLTGTTTRDNVTTDGTQAYNTYSPWAQNGISINGDGRYVVFASGANLVLDSNSTGNDVYWRDRNGVGFSTLSVNNTRAFEEGSATAPGSTTFTISLSQPAPQAVTVQYQTTDGTAKAGSDYVAKSGTITFAPGEITKFVRVNFIGDDVAEPNETLFLDLKSPVGVPLNDSRGSAYIRNDDGPSISIANAEPVTEGNGGTKPQKFIVTLSAPSTKQVRFDWSTANGTAGPADYSAAHGTLDFAPGQTSQTITVYVKGDTVVEPNETYKINLSNPQYATIADSQGIAYILNDDEASVTEEPSPQGGGCWMQVT